MLWKAIYRRRDQRGGITPSKKLLKVQKGTYEGELGGKKGVATASPPGMEVRLDLMWLLKMERDVLISALTNQQGISKK